MSLQSAIDAMGMSPEGRGGYPIAIKSSLTTPTIPDDGHHIFKIIGDMEKTLMGVVPVKLAPSAGGVSRPYSRIEAID